MSTLTESVRFGKIERALKRWPLGWALLVGVVGFLILYPLYWLGYGAIHDVDGNIATGAFADVMARPATWRILWNTVQLGVLSTALATIWAVPMAWLVTRTDMPMRGLFSVLPIMAYVTPPFLLAFGYVLTLGPNAGMVNNLLDSIGLPRLNIFSLTGLVFATAAHIYVFIFLAASAAMSRLDAEFEDAARMHGAGRLQAVWSITIRMAAPGILSGVLLAFVISQNVFGTHAIIGLPANIRLLTTEIYSYFNYPVRYTQAASISWLLFAVAGIAMTVNFKIVGVRSHVTVRGKGMRPSRVPLGKWKWLASAYCSVVVLITFVIPTGVIVLVSFLGTWGQGVSGSNLTLGWYRFILSHGGVRESIWNSGVLGVASATVMLALAALMSVLIIRTSIPGRTLLRYISIVPLTIPGIVLAVALIWAYIEPPLALYGTLAILGVAYVTKFYPVALNLCISSLEQLEAELEESGRIHGGSWWSVFTRVTLPLMKPGLVAAWVMTFVLSFRELAASILLSSPGKSVVAVQMFRFWEEGQMEALASFATLILLLITACYVAINRVAGTDAFVR